MPGTETSGDAAQGGGAQTGNDNQTDSNAQANNNQNATGDDNKSDSQQPDTEGTIAKSEVTYSKTLSCKTKLDFHGRNFLQWKSIMPIYLEQEPEIWNIISGISKEPKLPKEPTPAQKAEAARFKRLSSRARLLIIDSIEDRLATKIFYGRTQDMDPDEMWSSIVKTFSKQQSLSQSLAMTKFLRFKFKSNLSYEDNLDIFSRLMTEAAEAGASIDEAIQVQTLLQALPPVWNPIVLAW